jgi:CRP/FNR family transcriptional regulator
MPYGGAGVLDDAAVRDALASSPFRRLPASLLAELVRGASTVDYEAGASIHQVGQPGPYLELVVEGFLRTFVTAPDGRSLTVRYLRRGDLSGGVSLFSPDYVLAASVQAIVDSALLRFRADIVIGLAERDVRVARALVDELSARVINFVAEIPGSAFSTVRQRVARHVLDLASERRHGDRLLAPVSQQALADAVGSVREVVVRVLRELRDEGVIRTSRAGIEVIEPERLIVEQYPVARRPTVPVAQPRGSAISSRKARNRSMSESVVAIPTETRTAPSARPGNS